MPSFLNRISSLAQSKTGVFLFFSLLLALLYGQCLRFDFVSYDDDYHVYNNLSVREFSPASVVEIFSGKVRVKGDAEAQVYSNRIYIPVTFLSFQLQHALTGLNPLWFHAANILLFFLVVISVYQLLFFWLKHRSSAWLCTLLFAVHPLNAEPVAWISGRKDLLCGLFFIQGLLFYGKYALKPCKKKFILTLLCCLLATLAKPSGGIFIAVLLLYDFCWRRALPWKRLLLEKVLVLTTVLLPVLLSFSRYALENNPPASAERLLFSTGIPFFSLGHAFLPISLSAFYPYPRPLLWAWNEIALIGAGALGLCLLWQLAKRDRRLCVFGAAFFFTTLLPYGLRAVFFTDGGFTSDRYMLLPFIGLLLLLGTVAKQWLVNSAKKTPLQKTAVLLLGLFVLGAFAWTAHGRASVWNNSEMLALDIIQKYPNAANAQEELGRIYQQRGLRAEAVSHFKAAYLADPKIQRLIQLYEALGLNQALLPLYQNALRQNPNASRLQAGLGMVYFRLRHFVPAEQHLLQALQHDPGNAQIYNILAGALYYQNKVPQAIAAWEKALDLNPNDTDACNNLGAAYLGLGNNTEAKRLFEKTLALQPQHRGARSNLDKIKRLETRSTL